MGVEGGGGRCDSEEESNVGVEGGEVLVGCIMFWLGAVFVGSGR